MVGRVRNCTYSNDVFIFQQFYNKNLCDAESDLTKNSHRKPAPLQDLHGFPLQTCFPLFTVSLSMCVHRPPTVSGSLARERWQMRLGWLFYMNIN